MYTEHDKSSFFKDLRTQDAVIRNLETLAAATQRLPDEWKIRSPQVDWRKVADFRHFLAHQYLDISLDIIWDVVENEIPNLKSCIDSMAEKFWND